jgi:hypothetical protein
MFGNKTIFPWQKGFKEQKAANELALLKAKEELDGLSKGKGEEEPPNAMAALEKALLEFSETDDLSKSADGDADDKGGDDDKEKGKEGDEGEEDLEKSGGDDLEQELVRASIAFEGLTKSIEETSHDTQEGLELLAKGLGSVTELLISVGNGVVTLHKSMEEKIASIGAQPSGRSGVTFGLNKSLDSNTDGAGKTSVDEARTILIKAMEDGETIPSGLLSRLDTKKDTSIIPAELATKLNIVI